MVVAFKMLSFKLIVVKILSFKLMVVAFKILSFKLMVVAFKILSFKAMVVKLPMCVAVPQAVLFMNAGQGSLVPKVAGPNTWTENRQARTPTTFRTEPALTMSIMLRYPYE